MTASSPEDLLQHLLTGLNSGDVDGVAGLYEPSAVLAEDPSHALVGREAIKGLITAFSASHSRFTLHGFEVVKAGDVALVRSRWTVNTVDDSGRPLETTVSPAHVVRRNAAGHWLVAIDWPVASK
jgi:uncharacterized protein (TIGR02246 family)